MLASIAVAQCLIKEIHNFADHVKRKEKKKSKRNIKGGYNGK
jgi:hypothetical protein